MVATTPDIGRLILASGSARRKQLLSLLGLPFAIKAVEVDERPLAGEPPHDMVMRLSQAKARAVDARGWGDLVIGADTIVALDGEVLGKPVDAADAARMLEALRDRPHVVYTGVAVWHPMRRRMAYELGESIVWMRSYSDAEIRDYVASGDPMDKAGAYAIQHPEFDPVARVEGCWLNVMGLPLCHLGRALGRFGVVLPVNVPGSCRAFNQRTCAVGPEILGAG